MKHGIYLISRGQGEPTEYQLLRQHAYNNRFAGYQNDSGAWVDGDFWPVYQIRPYITYGQAGELTTNSSGNLVSTQTGAEYLKVKDFYEQGWSSWSGRWRFLQDDAVFGILASKYIFSLFTNWQYYTMGPYGRFTFATPSAYGNGTVTKVTIYAQISGAAKTVLRIGTTDYLGSYETNDAKLGWIKKSYTTNPSTGSAWSWSDLKHGTLIAGVWLEAGYIQTYSAANLMAQHYVGAASTCHRLKVRIDYINSSGVASYVELWPTGDSTCDDLSTWVGNIFALSDSPLYDDIENRFILKGSLNTYIERSVIDYPSGAIASAKVSYTIYSRTYYETHTVKPYVKIGSTRYYGTAVTLPICPSTAPATSQSYRILKTRSILGATSGSYTWSLNPATGAAWTSEELAACKYGVYVYKSATPKYTSPECFVKTLVFTITPSSGSAVTNSHGPISGSTITPIHCYPGYESKSEGKTRRWHSNIGEMPPESPTIGKVRIYYNYRSFSQSGSNYVRPFIYVGGKYYYGTSQTISNDPSELVECSYEWPAGTFTSDDLVGCTWGLEFYCSSAGWLWPEVLDIEFEHAAMRNTATYDLLDARCISLEKNYQVPIKPDTLKFASVVYVPERTEIAYFWNGACVFQGLVWIIDERATDYTFTAKSQQALLEHRALPEIHSPIVSGSAVQYLSQIMRDIYYKVQYNSDEYTASPMNTLGEILSSNPPSYLFNQFGAAHSIIMPSADGDEQNRTERVGRYVHLVESNLGALYAANSYIPPGQADGNTLPNMAVFLRNRPIRSFGRNVSPVRDDFSSPVSLVKGSSSPGNGEYYLGESDLTLNVPIDTRILLADNWADTHIRVGYIEHASKYLNQAYNFDSIASDFLNNLFTLLSQEVRFRPSGGGDATVYMDVADALGRGSEDAPIQDFVDGTDCRITKTLPSNPLPRLYVGQVGQNAPICAGDFEKAVGAVLIGSTQNDEKAVADEQDFIDAAISDDTTKWEIQSTEENPLLNPGDWISVDGEPVRIKRSIVTPGRTYLECGKLKNISTMWNDWADRLERGQRTVSEMWPALSIGFDIQDKDGSAVTASVNQYAMLLQTKEFSFNALSGSTTFTVPKINVSNDDWLCTLEIGAKEQELSPIDTMYHSAKGDVSKVSKIGTARLEYKGTWSGTRPNRLDIKVIEADDVYTYRMVRVYYRINLGSWIQYEAVQSDIYKSIWMSLVNGISVRWVSITESQYKKHPFSPNGLEWWCTIEFGPKRTSAEIKFNYIKAYINGKVVPPGRIPAKSNISIDITDYCTTSKTADKTNKVVINATGTAAGFDCAVKQYRRTKLMTDG